MNSDPRSDTANGSDETPTVNQVWDYLMFGTTVPERLFRSTTAMIGGVLKESSQLLVPQAFRTSKSYSIFVQQMLDFMTHDLGGVERDQGEASATEVENYVARKAVGNFIELAGLATLHLSPLTLLAIVSDVAYGSQTYLNELAEELKSEGLIPEKSTISHASDLLDAVREASGVTAQAFDLPPTSIEGLRNTIQQTQDAVQRLDPTTIFPQAEIDRIWLEIHEISSRENISLLGVGGAVSLMAVDRVADVGQGALSAVRVAGNLLENKILSHYSESLAQINERGFYQSLSEVSEPYMEAIWQNFSMEKSTVTEEVLSGRLTGRLWRQVGAWLKASPGEKLGKAETDAVGSVEQGKLEVLVDQGVVGLRAAIVVVRSAQVGPTSEALSADLDKVCRRVSDHGVEGGDARRIAVRQLLREGGYRPAGRNKPAQEYLACVLQREQALPKINNAVDLLNAHSLATGLPISLLSLKKAPGPWLIRYGREGEQFVFNGAGHQLEAEKLLCIVPETLGTPVGSPVKDSMAGKIEPEDHHLAMCIYAPLTHVNEKELQRNAETLGEAMAEATGGGCTQVTLLGSTAELESGNA